MGGFFLLPFERIFGLKKQQKKGILLPLKGPPKSRKNAKVVYGGDGMGLNNFVCARVLKRKNLPDVEL
ncbi:MAG: hypothetical protein ACQEXV_16645 [Bacillota bacterium]